MDENEELIFHETDFQANSESTPVGSEGVMETGSESTPESTATDSADDVETDSESTPQTVLHATDFYSGLGRWSMYPYIEVTWLSFAQAV